METTSPVRCSCSRCSQKGMSPCLLLPQGKGPPAWLCPSTLWNLREKRGPGTIPRNPDADLQTGGFSELRMSLRCSQTGIHRPVVLSGCRLLGGLHMWPHVFLPDGRGSFTAVPGARCTPAARGELGRGLPGPLGSRRVLNSFFAKPHETVHYCG